MGSGEWITFGYWVVHHGYLLTSCPGQVVVYFNKNKNNVKSFTFI